MKIGVYGLGRFGSRVARTLANLNADKIHLTRENDPETGFTELAVNEE